MTALNVVKRIEYMHTAKPEMTCHSEIFRVQNSLDPSKYAYVAHDKLQLIKHNGPTTQTATTDTMTLFETLGEALACMEKWQADRESKGFVGITVKDQSNV